MISSYPPNHSDETVKRRPATDDAGDDMAAFGPEKLNSRLQPAGCGGAAQLEALAAAP